MKKGPTATPAPVRSKGTRIIAIANQKGGVGKSTTAVSLGAALAEHGHRVLVLDLDPQGNASTGMGIRHEARDITVYDVVVAEAPIEDAIVQTPVERLWAIPSTIDLAGAEIELVSQFSRELRLRKALDPLADANTYDYILLDCPPSLGLLTINALAAARELIVPIQCEYYALEGLGQLLRNVTLVQQNINPGLQLTGIVMTMYDPRTRLSEQVVEEVRRYFRDRVYDIIIPRTVRLSEAPGFGQPITVYDPKSKGAAAYRELAREVDEKAPPAEPMPAFDDLPRVVVTPPAPSEPSAPVSTEEASAAGPGLVPGATGGPTPAPDPAQAPVPVSQPTRDGTPAPETPQDRTPPPELRPAPTQDRAPATATSPEAPAHQASPPPRPSAPDPAPPTLPAHGPGPNDRAPEPATPSGAEQPPPAQDAEAAEWLEDLARQSERDAEVVATSTILADVAAEVEQGIEDDEVWEADDPPAEATPDAEPSAPPSRAPGQRVVVIDDDIDIPMSEPPSRRADQREPRTAGAQVGATLEDEGSHKKRWRLFRKGGE
jgi:chromosome partitioning protein